MTREKLLILVLCLGACGVLGSPLDSKFKLENVQVLLRHGARTPVQCEAKMIPNINESFYDPLGYAQLTKAGMMEEYKIGQMLRNRYDDFLSAVYRPEDVYAFSSATQRTKASLQLVLAALYPPTKDLVWNEELNWIPIPINYNPSLLDNIMNSRQCPQYIEALSTVYNSTDRDDIMTERNDVLLEMRKIYGKKFKIREIICAYHIIAIHKHLNITLMPDWYTDEMFERLSKATKLYLDTLSATTTLKRLNAGPLIKTVVDNMNNTKPQRKKIYLYSGHDKNLYSFIKAHGLTMDKLPDYSMSIIIEKLSADQNKTYVKMLLWTGEPKKLITLKLPNCTEICPMNKYLKIVYPVLPSNEEMRCLFKNLGPKDIEKIVNTYNTE